MTTMDRYEPGTPSWVDLGTPDLDGAIAFYSGLFGWQVDKGGPEVGHYSMATLGGRAVAALADQQQPGVPPFWATYVTVEDVADTVAKAEAAGGAVVVAPMDVMEFGRMAIVADPGGAVLSLWQPGSHPGAGLVNEPGALCWNELTTRHVAEAATFLESVLGLASVAQDVGGSPYYELRRADGTTVAGMLPMVGDMWPAELPDHWMVYFAVEDADATAARCEALGGRVSVPPTDIPPGRFAVLNDPQGAVFSVIRLAPDRG